MTMVQFDPASAAQALLSRLPKETDGGVRYQILRALESLARKHPGLPLDRTVLDQAIEGTVRRAYRYLDRRHVVRRGVEAVPARATPGQRLLEKLLGDKERNAIERLFRLLALAYPVEDFVQIHRGLVTGRKDTRASSMELIENALEEPLRRAVLGLVDDGADEERLAAAGKFHTRLSLDYEALLEHLLKTASDSVQDVTAFHIGELRLVRFRDLVATLLQSRTTTSHEDETASDLARTLSLLSKEAVA